MTAQTGTIVSFDVIDGLGWIALDDGQRVRVGGNAMRGWTLREVVGVRVTVHEVAPGFGGTLRAVRVTPLDAPPAPARPQPPPPTRISWPRFVAQHPRFSDAFASAVPCTRAATPIALTPHPLFDPWRDEIARGTTVVGLSVPSWRQRDPIEPAPTDSFALGRTAFLDTPEWPRCGLCQRALMMCVQIAPRVMADFTTNGHGLVAMFCFACGTTNRHDPRVGFVRWVRPLHRVVGGDVFQDENQRSLQHQTQRVTAQTPQLVLPSASWLAYRSAIVTDTASAVLFGDAPFEIDDGPADLDDEMLDDVGASFDDWLDPQRPRGHWEGASLGGEARWDQADETPVCAHGEQLHLLDYEGGQFLDGALHVFVCRAGLCEMKFVAEF